MNYIYKISFLGKKKLGPLVSEKSWFLAKPIEGGFTDEFKNLVNLRPSAIDINGQFWINDNPSWAWFRVRYDGKIREETAGGFFPGERSRWVHYFNPKIKAFLAIDTGEVLIEIETIINKLEEYKEFIEKDRINLEKINVNINS